MEENNTELKKCRLAFSSCVMWVEFVVGSRPCSDGFSLTSPVFSPSTRIKTSKSQLDLETVDGNTTANSLQIPIPIIVIIALCVYFGQYYCLVNFCEVVMVYLA